MTCEFDNNFLLKRYVLYVVHLAYGYNCNQSLGEGASEGALKPGLGGAAADPKSSITQLVVAIFVP